MDLPTPRVLVFEDTADGHHLIFARHIIDELLARGATPVLATTPATTRSDAWRELLEPLGATLRTHPVAPPPESLSFALRHLWRAATLIQSIAAARPEHVVIPYIDGMALVLPTLAAWLKLVRPPGCTIDAVAMRVKLDDSRASRLKRGVMRSLLSLGLVDRLHVIDELSAQALRREARAEIAERIVLTPDPVTETLPTMSPPEARARLGLPLDRRLVLAIGMLSRRKGVAELIEAATAPGFDPQTTIVLAGEATEDIHALLETATARAAIDAGRLIVRPGFVPSDEFGTWFRAVDIVSALYQGHHGSSGIVIHAVQAGCPLVATREGWIGHVVETYELGETCDPGDAAAVGAALSRLGRDACALPLPQGRDAFLSSRTLRAFKDGLLRAVPDHGPHLPAHAPRQRALQRPRLVETPTHA